MTIANEGPTGVSRGDGVAPESLSVGAAHANERTTDPARSAGLLELSTLIAGAAIAAVFLYTMFNDVQANLDEFPEGTGGYYAHFEGTRVHCTGIEDAHECLDGLRQRGSKHAAIWLGNSQLHAVNQFKPGERHAPDILSRRLREDGLDLMTFSLPNGTLSEYLLIFSYVRQRAPLHLLILPLEFSSLRKAGIRATVSPALVDPGTVAILEQSEIGRELLVDNADSGNDDTSALDQTLQARWELALTDQLDEHSALWKLRPDARSWINHRVIDARDIVFGIDAQTKRPMLPAMYSRNMRTLETILDQAQQAGIRVLAYVVPIRNDVANPFIESEFERFKQEAEELTRSRGDVFANLEDLVPGELWGNQLRFGGKKVFDFAHFQASGHVLLASALGDRVEDRRLALLP